MLRAHSKGPTAALCPDVCSDVTKQASTSWGLPQQRRSTVTSPLHQLLSKQTTAFMCTYRCKRSIDP
eukprot:359990-Chlamydomonas_euryale.AAC.12